MEKIRDIIGPKGDTFLYDGEIAGTTFSISLRTYEKSEEVDGPENILKGEVHGSAHGSSVHVSMAISKTAFTVLSVWSMISLVMIVALITVKGLQHIIVISVFIPISILPFVVWCLVIEKLNKDFKSLVFALHPLLKANSSIDFETRRP